MLRSALLVAVMLGSLPIALADPVVPGTRVASHDDLGQRRAVRGATIEGHESEELSAMRRYEEEQLAALYGRGGPSVQPATNEPPAQWAQLASPDIPIRWDARLVRFLEFYKSDRRGRAIMASWLRAQGRYRGMIEDALRRHHLPHALLYISMIESGYDPHDRSLAGASGLWQFMPEGARIYGLRVDHWVDERDDPEKATEAQMRYFGDLWSRFGSWHIALAAFNAGYGAALAAIAKYNTNDYWTICTYEDGLPWETVLYVPKFLAATIVGENRAFFGYDELSPDPALAWDAVPVGASVTVEEAARAAGVTAAQVARLNPELRQDRTPPGERWVLKLPKGSGPRFLAHAASLDEEREALATYKVRLGDRIESIARVHKTSAARLRKLNGIRDLAVLRPGLILLVPALSKLALRGGSTVGAARDEAEGPIVIAVADKEAAVPGRKRLFYRPAPGDGLPEIARHFGVREDELVRWNRLDPSARLTSGLVLQVWVAPEHTDAGDELGAVVDPDKTPGATRVVTAGSEEFLDTVEGQRGRKRVRITARAGDTLKKIGLRYGLTEGDMERINQLGRGTALTPGQTVLVYLPMSAEERAEFAARMSGKPAAAPIDAPVEPMINSDAASPSTGPEAPPASTEPDRFTAEEASPKGVPAPATSTAPPSVEHAPHAPAAPRLPELPADAFSP